MHSLIKVGLSLGVILGCGLIGKKFPSLGGLVSVMPLTGGLALIWFWTDHAKETGKIDAYLKGAIWGIVPSVLFFVAALICLKRDVSMTAALAISFGVWVAGGVVHQIIMR